METEKTIAEKLKAKKEITVYEKAAKEFGVQVSYVYMIANSSRKPTRGKGKEIKEWLEAQV